MTGKIINIDGERRMKISLTFKQWIAVAIFIIGLISSIVGIHSKLDARMSMIDENRELLNKKVDREEFNWKSFRDSLNQEIIKQDLQEIKKELKRLYRKR